MLRNVSCKENVYLCVESQHSDMFGKSGVLHEAAASIIQHWFDKDFESSEWLMLPRYVTAAVGFSEDVGSDRGKSPVWFSKFCRNSICLAERLRLAVCCLIPLPVLHGDSLFVS